MSNQLSFDYFPEQLVNGTDVLDLVSLSDGTVGDSALAITEQTSGGNGNGTYSVTSSASLSGWYKAVIYESGDLDYTAAKLWLWFNLRNDGTVHYPQRAPGSTSGSSGSGADQVTVTITDGSDPIADGDVWVTSDAAGANVIAGTSQTDSAGQVVFLLDDGVTYYLWFQKNGYNSIQGESFVASAD